MRGWLMVAAVVCGLCGAACAEDGVGASYRAHLAASVSAMRLGEPAEARRWLEGAPWEMRGWEWGHLDVLLDQSSVVARELDGGVYGVSVHPGGAFVAISLTTGPILLWDVDRGEKRGELRGHAGGTFCARFSADGTRLVSGGADRMARVWDVASGEMLREFAEHKFPVSAAVFSVDRSEVFSSAYYVDKETPIHGRVLRWSVGTGEVLGVYRGGVKPLSALVLSADGRRVAAGSWDSCAFVWDVAGGAEQKALQLGRKPSALENVHVNAVDFSPDRALLAVAADDGTTRVYRVSDGVEAARLADGARSFESVAFAPDGTTLATGSDRGAITLWAVGEWSARGTMSGHTAGVKSLAWSADGARLYSGGPDRTVRVFDVETRAELSRVELPAGAAYLAWHPDGARVAVGMLDGTAALVDFARGGIERVFKGHTKGVNSVAFDEEGTRLVTGSADASARVWDVGTGECVAVMGARTERAEGHARTVESAVFVAGTRWVATGSHDGSVRLWDGETGEMVRALLVTDDEIYRVASSPDGKRIAAGGLGFMYLLDPASEGALVRERPVESAIWHLDWSPTGDRLAVGSWNGEIVVFSGAR